MARGANDLYGVYRAPINLGWTRLCTGAQDQAAALFGEANNMARSVGHTKGMAVSLTNLAWIALYQEDLQDATELATDGRGLCHQLGEKEILAEYLAILRQNLSPTVFRSAWQDGRGMSLDAIATFALQA